MSDQDVSVEEVTKDDFDSYIAAAADALSPLDYEIRSTFHQQTKERVYAIVNSISDPLTQMATTRTSEEMFYIKRLLDAIFETHNTRRREVMAIRSMQALERKVIKPAGRRDDEEEGQLAADKGLTGEQAEKLLDVLVAEKWLEKSKESFYRLSPRALMELRGWLVDAYNEETEDPEDWQRIKFCEACKEIVTVGQRCSNLDCNVRLHDICETAFWNSRPSKHCPKCDTAWTGQNYVGEKAITSTEEYLRGKRRSGGAAKRSRVEEESENEEQEEAADSRRASRNGAHVNGQQNGASRRKSRRASPESEDEEEEEEEGDEEDGEEEDE